MSTPLLYRWDGEAMRPVGRFAKEAETAFKSGLSYKLVEVEDRSMRSHRHYFAELHQLWLNLPEEWGEQFVDEEHMRKFALIRAGYCESRQITVADTEEAKAVAAFIRPMDDYSVVAVNDCVVTVYTAESQSVKNMGNKRFQKSKTDVLDYLWSIVGISRDEAAPHIDTVA